MAEPTPTKPKNVVILDAENPLVEVRGEFFWREDHELLLTAAREQSFRDGFSEGYAAAIDNMQPTRVVLRRRPRGRRLLVKLFLALLMLSLLASLVLTALEAAVSHS